MPLTTESLVSTKLRPSQARPKLVARLRLTATLEREPGRKLTLISAPAGFGKTTLLVEWLRERAGGEGYVAWLSLDEGDNDPVRFLAYLVAALRRTVEEGFGEGILAALRSPQPPRLEERTEGWVAGLQLAALSMRDREDVSGFVESFSGSHRDVLDFLAEEVLERQPERVQSFLLETSILDNLTGSLCDALTGRSDGDEMLM